MISPVRDCRKFLGPAGASVLATAVLIVALWAAPHTPAARQTQAGAAAGESPVVIEKGDFRFACDERGVSGLANPRDPFQATLMPAAGPRGGRPPVLGLTVCYRAAKTAGWTDIASRGPKWTASPEAGEVSYRSGGPEAPVKIVETYRTDGRVLDWTIALESTGAAPVEIGDLAVSIPAAGPFGENPAQIFERGFLRHQFISGAGSFVYFVRASGAPPYLLLTVRPSSNTGKGEEGRAAVSSSTPAGAAPRKNGGLGARPTLRSTSRPRGGPGAASSTASGSSGRRATTSSAPCFTRRGCSTFASSRG
jgi:hypothetical protein